MEELIVIEQLPIIRQKFEELAKEINNQVEYALSLECNEQTYKEVKKYRAALNADKKELEQKRIAVKKAIMNPYEQFEAIYKELIGNVYANADNALASKISAVENGIKAAKAEQAIRYFNEYAEEMNVANICNFEDSGIKVGMSDTANKLNKASKEYIDGIAGDIDVINSMDDSAQIMTEYLSNGFKLSLAVNTIKQRNEALRQAEEIIRQERERKEAEAKHTIEVAEAISENAEEIENPEEEVTKAPETEEPIQETVQMYKTRFTVNTTLDNLKALVEFMRERGISYEQF